jgi:hypothetical protein
VKCCLKNNAERLLLSGSLANLPLACVWLKNDGKNNKALETTNDPNCMTPVARPGLFLRLPLASFLTALLLLPLSGAAWAHVKWFAPYDLICPPRPLFSVMTGGYFVMFCGVMVALMFMTAYVDVMLTHRAGGVNQLVQRISDWFEPNVYLLMRIGVFGFLTAVSIYGNVLLTPELKTDWKWVPWLQMAMALLVLHPRTAWVTALGICVLYGIAIYQYGWFHLMDYPIFLGVAFYLFTMSRYGEKKAVLALTVLRVLTGITLLWAGMEKFAYPDWSFPLLLQRPGMAFGFDPEFFMVAAGFVEFTAAFLVITVSIAARAASALLLLIFSAAIPEFGVVDAVGHAVIIVVLIALIFSHNPIAEKLETRKGTAVTATVFVALYFVALALEGGFFYGTHWLAYGARG